MARRVNTKFLVIFSVIVLGGVASAFVAQGPLRNLIRGDRSKKQIEAGDDLVKRAANAGTLEKKTLLEEAGRNYVLATNTETRNPELFVKLGDVYSRLAQFDLGYIQQSHVMWDKAVEIDPRYTPALRRLMDSYYKQTKGPGVVTYIFSRLQERATALHAVDPKDVRAHAIMNIAPIKQWLANIETQPLYVDKAIEGLTALIDDNPTAPELADMVFHMAMAKVKRGIELKGLGQVKDGNTLISEAVKAFGNAIKRDAQSAALHYRFFQLLIFLRNNNPEGETAQQYTQTLKTELDNARNLIAPEDEDFVEVYLASYQVAKILITKADDKTAETILLTLYHSRPDDQRVRLAIARMWRTDRAKRDLGIKELEKPMIDTGWVGVEAFMKQDLELQSWAELCNLYIERYASLQDEKKPEELKRIEETYEKLYSKARERADVLKIRGKIELLRGGPDANINAINTFLKAQNRYMVDHNGNEDLDLCWELVKAYFRSGEYGSAKTQLLKLKEKSPDSFPVRLRLAMVLNIEGDNKAARVEVEFLENQAPEDPEVLRLLLLVLDGTKDAIKVKSTFAKFAESTRGEQMSKAQIANLPPVSSPEEAIRLYKVVLASDPADLEALQGVRQVLGKEREAEALALFKAAQKAKPDDDKIAYVIKQLEGVSPEKLTELSLELIRKQLADKPFELELKLYEFKFAAAAAGDRSIKKQDAFAHLQAAEKLKPEDVQVLKLMFQYYLSEAKWDKAGEYVEKLAAKNADNVGGRIFRFQLAMARGDLPGATKVAGELTGPQWREFARSWIFLAEAQQAAKNYDAAIGSYNMALEKQSDNVEALAGIIACYFQTAKPTEAYRYINRARAAHPGNAYFKDQWTRYQLSQYGDASQVVKPALEERDAKPQDPQRWIALGRAQYSAAQKRDKPEESAKYIADAKATFTEALKKWPKEMVIWAYLSEIADFNGDAAGGEALLKDMVARPEFERAPEPALMLADHYLRHNAADKAEETMKQTLERFKDYKAEPRYANEVRRKLAAYYTQNKRWDDALKLLEPVSSEMSIRQQMVEIYMLQAASEKNNPELFAKAEKLVRSMLAANPEDAQLHALLGVVMLNVNQPQRAQESLGTALKLDPKNQMALYWRGQLRLIEKPPQLEGAVQDLSALRDLNPNNIDGRIRLADALHRQNHNEDAARELEYALIRQPFRKDIRVTLVGLYADIKPNPMWSDVDRIITDAEKLEPTELLWKRMLAKLWSTRAMHEKAAIKIREALNIGLARVGQPQFNQQNVQVANADLLRDYLDILETAKYWPQLQRELDRVFGDPKIAQSGWWFYVKRAVTLRNVGQPREAMADFEKAMKIVEADKTLSQDTMILIIDKIDQTMTTQEAIDRVTTLAGSAAGPQATRWKVVLARLYYKKKDFPTAVENIEQALKEYASLLEEYASLQAKRPLTDKEKAEAEALPKQQASALNVAGTIYMMSGNYPKARAVYEQLLAKRSNDLGALNNLAFIVAEHIQPADLPKALEYSQRAYDVMVKEDLKDANVLDTVGWINVLSGGAKLDEGIKFLTESIAVGEIAEAHYHYGEALMRKKMPEYAKASFIRASELIRDKEAAEKQPVDEDLKKRVGQAILDVSKVLDSTGVKQ